MATAIRMRTLVLEEIRSSACALIVACRPLPVAVPVPVDNPRGALAPLGFLPMWYRCRIGGHPLSPPPSLRDG